MRRRLAARKAELLEQGAPKTWVGLGEGLMEIS